MNGPAGAAGLSLYIHWPFCLAKCPYCDFNSHVARETDDAGWRDALLSEMAAAAAETPGRRLDTVFFGGGTPSLMPAATVGALLEAAARHWTMAADAEITLEANPTSVEAERFRGYRAAGVNRVSLGIQSLRDADLRALGRRHDAAEARAAIALARATFPRMSFDLIYARQNQTLADWRAELGEALALAADHLSLYQLTIEAGTPFAERHARGGLAGLPDEDLAADMYALTAETCAAAGLPAYEVSNHAAPGSESRHNLTYWRGGDWAGIGPGAHGRLGTPGGRLATETHRDPATWRAAVAARGTGRSRAERLSGREAAEEYLMMALRLAEGASPARFAALGGEPLPGAAVAALVAEGLLTEGPDRIAATARGRLLLNALLRALLA